jgi:AcrR family transcriptional regulator
MPLTQSTRPQSTRPQPTRRDRLKADRREELLRIAARLFAERGFRAVSLEELGAAAGVTGPAVYRHFASKQAVLADLLVGVSRRLLDGGRVVVGAAATDEDALRGLIGFHTDFALSDPDLIRVQDRDLNSLTAAWVAVLARLDAGLDPSLARIKAHATFGLLNSTSHSRGGPDTETSRRLLGEMAMAGLLPPRPVVGA